MLIRQILTSAHKQEARLLHPQMTHFIISDGGALSLSLSVFLSLFGTTFRL